jgi:hypothetical protein
MTPGSPLAAAVFAIVVTAVLARGGAAQTAVEIATGAKFDVAPGGTVEFRGVNGEATFVGAPGTQVVVFYARDVPADVKIVTFSTPAGLTVCTVYVSTDPKKPTECLPGGKGRLAAGRIRDQSRVRFRIQVPRGVHVRAGIDQGDLKSGAITGNLHLYSNNGDVLVHDGGGPGTITAGVGLLGNIDAILAKAQNGPARREVRLTAAGGTQIRVGVPAGVGLSYSVSTQRPATFAPAFGERKTAPPLVTGHLGTLDEHVRLVADTGISARFVALQAK